MCVCLRESLLLHAPVVVVEKQVILRLAHTHAYDTVGGRQEGGKLWDKQMHAGNNN